MRGTRLAFVLLPMFAACTGKIEQHAFEPPNPDPTVLGPDGQPIECSGVATTPGERALQRLTSRELDRTVAAALGDTTHAFASRMSSSDELLSAKQRTFRAQTASTVWAEGAILAAEEVSIAVAAKPQYQACTGATERACVQSLVAETGRILWRRTLTTDDVAAVMAAFDTARADGTAQDAMQTALQTLLVAPDFFFFQQPANGEVKGTVLAERLASALWQQGPDLALVDAAESGALDTTEGFDAQLERMLADPRADETFRNFMQHWLAPEKVATIAESLGSATRNPSLYPDFKSPGDGADGLQFANALDAWMASEARVNGGTFESLLLSPKIAVNEAIARNLGLPAATGIELRMNDTNRRVGVLGQPGVLTAFGRFESSDPVHRGVFLLRHALCNDLPPPDASVNTSLPAQAEFATTRDRFTSATTNSACAGCHKLINPLGFAFENFDAIGRFRTTEGTAAVDATATLPNAKQSQVDGLADLALVMSSDPTVRSCVARQFSSWALKRVVTEGEYCTVRNGAAPFFEGSGSIAGLVRALVRSDAFTRPALPGSTP